MLLGVVRWSFVGGKEEEAEVEAEAAASLALACEVIVVSSLECVCVGRVRRGGLGGGAEILVGGGSAFKGEREDVRRGLAMAARDELREENVYMAKLAEQAERYDEMVEAMEKVAKTVDVEELTVEERNLLSVAYKNVIGARRASWRIISSIEQKEESKGNDDHVAMIKDYRAKVESELSTICESILNLLDTHLIPTSTTGESKVFYLKMKGDYHRYLAEFKTGAERKEAAESTLLAYKSAQVSSSNTFGLRISRSPNYI